MYDNLKHAAKQSHSVYAEGAALGGAANFGGVIRDTATALSPIQNRLMEQESLLSELGQEIDRLANSVSMVMQGDPRSQTTNGQTPGAVAPASCHLESRIGDSNALISSSVTLLRQIRNQIQL